MHTHTHVHTRMRARAHAHTHTHTHTPILFLHTVGNIFGSSGESILTERNGSKSSETKNATELAQENDSNLADGPAATIFSGCTNNSREANEFSNRSACSVHSRTSLGEYETMLLQCIHVNLSTAGEHKEDFRTVSEYAFAGKEIADKTSTNVEVLRNSFTHEGIAKDPSKTGSNTLSAMHPLHYLNTMHGSLQKSIS